MDFPFFWELFLALVFVELLARTIALIHLIKTPEVPNFFSRKVWGVIILLVYFGWVVYAVMVSRPSKRL